MIDIQQLPQNILADIRQNHSDEEIAAMTLEQAFKAYCQWHGLRGYAAQLIHTIDAIRLAESEAK